MTMEERILVTYASTHGSTQEAAMSIAETLRGHGLAVDVQPMRAVRTLQGYHAVVMGAPLYMFHWHKDLPRFLSQHKKALSNGLPAALFTGGPTGKGDEDEWQEVRKQVEKELATVGWFKPRAVKIIGGRFDPTRLRLPWSLIPAMRNMPPSDLRDWEAIRAWADSLPQALLQAVEAQR